MGIAQATHRWEQTIRFRATRCPVIGLRLLLLSVVLAGAVLSGEASASDTATTGSDKLTWSFRYDDLGRPSTVIGPSGSPISFRYEKTGTDGRGQRFTREYADGTKVSYEFDERGRQTRMTDPAGAVSYAYDDVGRLTRVQREGGPAITYAYDTLDRVTRLQVGDFYSVDYTYDFLGRLASMKTPAGVVEYEYLRGQGQVVRTLPNGVKTFWKWQPNGQLEEITHGFSAEPNDNKYVVLAQYVYAYDPDGRITAIRERSGQGEVIRRYTYDTMGRLTTATGSDGREYRYEYDQVGNRTRATLPGQPEQTCTYDWAGRLTSLDGKPCEHDAAGNLSTLNLGGGTLHYVYNQDGQLADALGGKVTYRYDGDGKLILRRGGGVEASFVPDPRSLIWRPLVITEKGRGRTLVIWDGASPLITIRDGKPEYLLHDHLGSVRLVVNDRGQGSRQLAYEPFGLTEGPATKAEFGPRFAGSFWDPDARVYLTMARAYLPEIGGFIQSDSRKRVPDGSQNSVTMYSYCAGDPVNYLDQDGLERRHYAEPVDIFVSGISMRDKDAQRVARQFLGPGATGIAVDYGPIRWFDRFWAAADQTAGGHTTNSEEKLWSRLSQYQSIGTMEIYSHGAITTGNLSEKIDDALNRGSMHINEVVFYGVNADEHLVSVLKKHGIPYSVRAHKYDPVRIVTTPNSELGGYVPILGRIPGVRWLLGGAAKVVVAATLLPGIPGPYSTNYHDINFLHGVAPSTDKRPSTAAFRSGPRLPSPSHRPSALHVDDDDDDYFPFPPPFRRSFAAAGIGLPPWDDDDDDDWPPPPLGGGGGGWPPPPPGGGGAGALAPSRVGGVFLGGAGGSLAGLGLLEGVGLDRNGNLVLLGKAGDQTKLPPLRLDDVVTVFRSVYWHGEGPTVTIDPNSQDPERLPMIVKHSEATKDTYAGWVLFQADRLMKSYTLGRDNISEREVESRVPGYPTVLETMYFGGEDPGKLQREGHWERFWIVPAQVRRLGSARNELILFDVPLKVNTQTMKWQGGELVDDPSAKSSPGALAFTAWFTANYDLIAEEQFLTPPPESGILEPVPVFTELRRIALITAIAEKLRDQGVPMPFWMREYEVRPVPFEKTTPGREVTRSNQRVIARIFGGVNLSAEDKNVQQLAKGFDLSSLPPADRDRISGKMNAVDFLEKGVREPPPSVEPLKPWTLSDPAGGTYQAIAVPGTETQALAPCRLEEADLAVAVDGGRRIELVRSYNSFFQPSGPWGKGWALDLPRLDEIKVPIERDTNQVQYQVAYELVTPLNSMYVRLARIEKVPELNDSSLQVPDKPCEFFGLADAKPDFLSGPTRQLIRKDGGVWHFSHRGDLVAVEQDGFRTVYERDEQGRLTKIVGLMGRQSAASIELGYDTAGRLTDARTKGPNVESSVRYEYDDMNRLAAVVTDSGRLAYRYEGPWVTEVMYRGRPATADETPEEKRLWRFEYNTRGQLIAQIDATGARTEFQVTVGSNSTTVTMARPGGDSQSDTVTYDGSLRPVQARYADGTQASWDYPETGGVVSEIVSPDGQKTRLAESANRRERTLELAGRSKITGEYDAAGRLTRLSEGGHALLRQEWSGDGRLLKASNETSAVHVEYNPDGLVSRTLWAPPEERDLKQWQETKFDDRGRAREITDYRGLEILVDYDAEGQPRGMVCKRDGKNYGFRIARDSAGRVQEVESSWGNEQYTYAEDGTLKTCEIENDGRKASVEWESGLIRRVVQFDGGQTRVRYGQGPSGKNLPREIHTPNDLRLSYDYDQQDRLTCVDVQGAYRTDLAYDAQGRLASLTQSPQSK